MDPNEALRLWREAESPEERAEHAQNIRQWVARGGFQPDWSDNERRSVLRLGERGTP